MKDKNAKNSERLLLKHSRKNSTGSSHGQDLVSMPSFREEIRIVDPFYFNVKSEEETPGRTF